MALGLELEARAQETKVPFRMYDEKIINSFMKTFSELKTVCWKVVDKQNKEGSEINIKFV